MLTLLTFAVEVDMKISSRLRPTKMNIATSALVLSCLWGFASVAISATSENAAAPAAAPEAQTAPVDEISDGSMIQLGDGLAIAPIQGWKIERKSMGMGLVMKEVLPPQTAPVDYTKPIFTRNITLVTLPEARPMDDATIEELKTDISKMIARGSSLNDFTFTDAKFFDYKGKNDGVVLFSQMTLNGFAMSQMHVVVSGAKKSYLVTYSDLTSNFANPATYDAAWKSMTSIAVDGVAPKRYEKEMMIGGAFVGGLVFILVPFMFARWMSSRRIRKLADELQYDWDHGAVKSDADYDLSDVECLDATRPAKRKSSKGKFSGSEFDIDVSSLSAISTRHSRFA